ncbi:MAG: hypothetical protein IK081_10425 [Lachnospiraceae bacterium]|nr:hypothetical protein [Lachnospiraceae bacterium]
MKKMSFVTKGLALLLMGAMLAGCGDKATESSSDDKQQESSVEDKSSESSEVKESTEDASTEESTEESSVASTDESTQESSQAADKESSGSATGYEEYFKNFSMEGKKLTIDMEEELNGQKVSINMTVGNENGNNYVYMSVPSQEAGKNNEMIAYFMNDQTAYAEFSIVGEDPVAQKTTGMDPATAEQLNLAGNIVNLSEDGNISLKKLGQETIDGVTYDVLQLADSEEATLYVNLETKEWEILKAAEGEQEVVAYILPCEKIELPAAYASAEEVGSDDFLMTVYFGMMGIISGVSGQ